MKIRRCEKTSVFGLKWCFDVFVWCLLMLLFVDVFLHVLMVWFVPVFLHGVVIHDMWWTWAWLGSAESWCWWCLLVFADYSGQIIIFHQPRFAWKKGISLTKPPFGVRLCEVAIIWPNYWCLPMNWFGLIVFDDTWWYSMWSDYSYWNAMAWPLSVF